MNTQSTLILSGWAHGTESIHPIATALPSHLDVTLMSGAQALTDGALPPADVIITGSMGGLLALQHLPPSCQKLVLISSTARFCSTDDYPHGTHDRIIARMMRQLERNPAAVLQSFYKNVHHPAAVCATDPECSPEQLLAGLDYLRTADFRENVASIDIPICLIHGTDDGIIPASAARWIHQEAQNSELHLIKGGGHALPAHQFHDVMDILHEFL